MDERGLNRYGSWRGWRRSQLGELTGFGLGGFTIGRTLEENRDWGSFKNHG